MAANGKHLPADVSAESRLVMFGLRMWEYYREKGTEINKLVRCSIESVGSLVEKCGGRDRAMRRRQYYFRYRAER